MPSAVRSAATDRKELKSLPDGFVVLQRMTYGQVVERRALMKLSLQMSGKANKDFKGEMAMASVEIQRYEFQHCIVDHNLEDDTGRKLNLNSANDFGILDPKVGQEIEKYIGDMNNFDDLEENEELGN